MEGSSQDATKAQKLDEEKPPQESEPLAPSQPTGGQSSGLPNFVHYESDEEEGGEDFMKNLGNFFYKKLGFGNKDEDEPQVHYLEEPTIDGVVKYMNSDKCKNVIAMVGAGISTAAGIPDFRSPSSGIYSKLGKYRLPTPEAIFDISFFRENPAPFFELAKELFPKNLKPTSSHYFLRLLNDKGLLLRLYTQNIDTLERAAGVPDGKIVEAHGTFHTSHCLKCKKEYPLTWMKEKIQSSSVPQCVECGSTVKPDIVFFGERLPERFFQLADEDFPSCDLLIIIGTSLQVQPFAGLVDRVHPSIPRLLINLEKCGQGNLMSRLLGLGCGLEFDSESNFRDVALLGRCDDGCAKLAGLLGWKEDLDKLIAEGESDLVKETVDTSDTQSGESPKDAKPKSSKQDAAPKDKGGSQKNAEPSPKDTSK